MTLEEGKQAIAELKSEGNSEEEILYGFYRMFQEGEIDINILEALTHLVGYELTEEFKNMSPEDQKTKGYEEEEVEDAEEKAEAIEDMNESEEAEEPEEAEEEDEKDKAMKLFGL